MEHLETLIILRRTPVLFIVLPSCRSSFLYSAGRSFRYSCLLLWHISFTWKITVALEVRYQGGWGKLVRELRHCIRVLRPRILRSARTKLLDSPRQRIWTGCWQLEHVLCPNNPAVLADHLTITFCPAVPTFVDQHVPPRFRRLVSRQVSEMLWTPIVIASICGSLAVLLLLTMIYMWRSKVPEPPMMIDSRAHPPLTLLPPRRPPRSYIPKPRSQLFRDIKLFPAMHSEPMSVWED
ncbi:hypothetical protein EV421DRAFT_300076 [Armillaria borealis]|uniref:Uncharacterized protein n=1 Tax=Armillaria borealis TaxID=47425 RepID=A0AA39JSU2_9AGAR|nr:hypothetical protein EV421DRAFT_300076 [Armillaria borealis]